jgi:hypothetical protein
MTLPAHFSQQLERLIDVFGVPGVLAEIAHVCEMKADGYRTLREDEQSALVWDGHARLIDRTVGEF